MSIKTHNGKGIPSRMQDKVPMPLTASAPMPRRGTKVVQHDGAIPKLMPNLGHGLKKSRV